MRFGLLYEHPLPRPWEPGDERRVLAEALEQLEAADRLGFHRVWVAEHHFQEERSHSSAPSTFLGAASQRTTRLRLGLGPLPLSGAIRHPVVVAETVASLAALAGDRVDLATGEASVGAEVGGFATDRAGAVAEWSEQLDAVVRMLDEEPFAGTDGRYVRMPPRTVVPRGTTPGQWRTCSRPEDVRDAAECGLGVLAQWLPEPGEAAEWVAEHRAVLASDRCLPVAAAGDPAFAVVLPLFVHEDEQEAIDRGIDGAHFHAYAREHYETFGNHLPGSTDLWAEFVERREDIGFSRAIVRADGAPLSIKVLREGRASLRGAIGTPDQVRALVQAYDDVGVDELVFVVQAGRTPGDQVLESLELFGREVLPAFADAAAAAAPAVDLAAARARRPAAPAADASYAFGPMDGGASADASNGPGAATDPAPSAGAPERSGGGAVQRWGAARVRGARGAAEARAMKALRIVVRRSDDRRLERTVGSSRGLATLFAAMASRFEPPAAAGFTGDLRYELRGADGAVRTWTVTCRHDGASASAAARPDPAVTIKLGLADFVRLAAGELDPGRALLTGQLDLEGDFAVATRLGEMFGVVG